MDIEDNLTDDRTFQLVRLMEQASVDANGDWSRLESLLNSIDRSGLPGDAVRDAIERFRLSVALQWDLGDLTVVPLLIAILRTPTPSMLNIRLAAELASWAVRTGQRPLAAREFYMRMSQAVAAFEDRRLRNEGMAILAAAPWPDR